MRGWCEVMPDCGRFDGCRKETNLKTNGVFRRAEKRRVKNNIRRIERTYNGAVDSPHSTAKMSNIGGGSAPDPLGIWKLIEGRNINIIMRKNTHMNVIHLPRFTAFRK